MSVLTVKRCMEMFPQLSPQEMGRLMGTDNYGDNDAIKANRVAAYSGKCDRQLSIFYAKNDTSEFIPMLSGSKQKDIMQLAGITPDDARLTKNKPRYTISMDESIFNYKRKNSA